MTLGRQTEYMACFEFTVRLETTVTSQEIGAELSKTAPFRRLNQWEADCYRPIPDRTPSHVHEHTPSKDDVDGPVAGLDIDA